MEDMENCAGDCADAVVGGVLCLDLAPAFHNEEISAVGELLRPSSTILTGGLTITPGGVVSNTGIAMSRFGVHTTLMGRVGQDDLGKIILKRFRGQADTDHIRVSKDETTSYSLVIAPKGIDRFFIHDPSVSSTFTADHIDYEVAEKTRLFHFGYLPVMKRMCEDGGAEAVRMYRRIHEAGVTTSMDLCMPDITEEIPEGYWRRILSNVLPYVDLTEPSLDELCYMLNPERYRELAGKAKGSSLADMMDLDEIRGYAGELLDMGAAAVLIKCGTRGMYLKAGSGKRLEKTGKALRETLTSWNENEVVQRCFIPENFVNANGAGDVSIAAFLTSVLRGCSAKDAVRNAAAAGAECCEGPDPVTALTDFETLLKRIGEGWKMADSGLLQGQETI